MANGTDDGVFEIETGQNDIFQLGHVTSWRQSRSVHLHFLCFNSFWQHSSALLLIKNTIVWCLAC